MTGPENAPELHELIDRLGDLTMASARPTRESRGRPTQGWIEERVNADGTITFSLRFKLHGRRRRKRVAKVRKDDYHQGRLLAELELTRHRYIWGSADQLDQPAGMSWNAAIEGYAEWLDRHRSGKTKRRYMRILRHWCECPNTPTVLDDVTVADVERYAEYAHDVGFIDPRAKSEVRRRPLSGQGVNKEISVLGRFWRWCAQQPRRWVREADNPFEKVEPMREEETGKRGKSPLRTDEVQAFRLVAPLHVAEVVEFCLHTGLRRDELVYLNREDIDTDQLVVRVLNRRAEGHTVKGGHERKVPLPREAVEAWRRFDAWAEKRGVRDNRIAFVAPRGGRWTKLGDAVLRYMAKAGVHASIHSARHTYCVHALRHTGDVYKVMVWMGHRDLATTQRYQHYLPEGDRRAMEGFAIS